MHAILALIFFYHKFINLFIASSFFKLFYYNLLIYEQGCFFCSAGQGFFLCLLLPENELNSVNPKYSKFIKIPFDEYCFDLCDFLGQLIILIMLMQFLQLFLIPNFIFLHMNLFFNSLF